MAIHILPMRLPGLDSGNTGSPHPDLSAQHLPYDSPGGPWTSHGILPVLDGLLGDIEDDYYKLPHMFLLTCRGLVQTPSLKLGMTPVALPLRYILPVFDHCLLFEAPLDMISPTYRPYTWYIDHLSPSGTSTKYRPTWV